MKLFVGLGNPGTKHARNRHNVGFMAIDRIHDRYGFTPWKKKFSGLAADGDVGGERTVLLKPSTYMNDSGRSVGDAARFLKIGEDGIVVFHDEIDLTPGKLKLKVGGGNAGHNGLRSITAHIGNEYRRVRIGVGHPGAKELVQGWVLRDFAKADETWLEPLLDAISAAAQRLAKGDDARFLTDVARALTDQDNGDDAERRSPIVARKPVSTEHPAGERSSKRQSALATNLKKWFAARDKKQS